MCHKQSFIASLSEGSSSCQKTYVIQNKILFVLERLARVHSFVKNYIDAEYRILKVSGSSLLKPLDISH